MEPQPQQPQPHPSVIPAPSSVIPAKAGTHVTRTTPFHPSRENDPLRCRRCPSDILIRLHKTLKTDNDIFRCTQCGLLFSPPTRLSSPSVRPERREQVAHPAAKSDVQPAPEVEGHPHKTTNPKLTSYDHAANKTTQTRPNTPPSYDPATAHHPKSPQLAPKTPPPSYAVRPMRPS